MSRALAAGRVVRSRRERTRRCLALSGKGAPAAAVLDEAIEAVTLAAEALRDTRLRGAHPLGAAAPEVRLREPLAGARGGSGWTVLVPVPAWVGEGEAEAAVEAVSRRHPLAKNIRLSPVTTAPVKVTALPGRDHQPGQIRRRRSTPQHAARELR
jgi:hypothetical protein